MKSFFYKLIIIILLILPFFHCKPPYPDMESLKKFNKNGISFKYPGNWNIIDSSKELSSDKYYKEKFVLIKTGDKDFLKITVMPLEDSVSLVDYLNLYKDIRLKTFKKKAGNMNLLIFSLRPVDPLTTEGNINGNKVKGYSEYYGITVKGKMQKIFSDHYKTVVNKRAVYFTMEEFAGSGVVDDLGFQLVMDSLRVKY